VVASFLSAGPEAYHRESDLKNRFTLPTFIWLIPLVLIVFAGLTWVNYQYAGREGAVEDFIPGWVGTRLFFTEGIDPYSPEASAEIQKLASSASLPSESTTPGFTYPLYAILIFAPFAFVGTFELAAALWLSVLEISLVLICLAGVSLSRWQIKPWLLFGLIAFSIGWYPSFHALLDGNPAILCSLLLVGALWAMHQEQDALAAILLVLASIMPSMVIVLVLFIILWAISTKRSTLVWGIPGILVLLVAATSLLIPQWVIEYVRIILQQVGQIEVGTPRALFMYWIPGIGKQLGWLLTFFSGFMLIWEWRQAAGMNFRWFLWAAYFSLAFSGLIGIPTSVENQAALIPAVILVLAVWDERWGTLGRWLIASSLILLSVGLWWLGLVVESQGISPDLSPLLFFAVPVFTIIGLYWVRWWAIRASRLPLQEITERLG